MPENVPADESFEDYCHKIEPFCWDQVTKFMNRR